MNLGREFEPSFLNAVFTTVSLVTVSGPPLQSVALFSRRGWRSAVVCDVLPSKAALRSVIEQFTGDLRKHLN
jgi:hypothetical protein